MHGLQDSTTDPEKIRAWWTAWPDSNIGGRPGQAGYLVIDVDGPVGRASAQQLGLLSEPTLEVETGRANGGRHRWYKHPGGHIGNTPLAPGLDVRADMGYVLLPPSIHRTGARYRARGTFADVIELPPAVAELLRGATATTATPREPIPDRIEQGARDATLTRLAGMLRRGGASAGIIRTALGAWNIEHVSPPLPDRDLERIARSVARYAPAPESAPTAGGAADWPTARRGAWA
jgi:hypothetical protein